MHGYINDDDKDKVHMIAKNMLSPILGKSVEELESKLLFGSMGLMEKLTTRVFRKQYRLPKLRGYVLVITCREQLRPK